MLEFIHEEPDEYVFSVVNICFSFFIRWTTQETAMQLLKCPTILSALFLPSNNRTILLCKDLG
jgi:hypothetical protein